MMPYASYQITVIRNQQVAGSSPASSSRNSLKTIVFREFLFAKVPVLRGSQIKSHPMFHTGEKKQRTGREVQLPARCAV